MKCELCDGSGYESGKYPCVRCEGTGKLCDVCGLPAITGQICNDCARPQSRRLDGPPPTKDK